MLSRYERTFVRLADQLNALKEDPRDLEALWSLQQQIIQKLRRCERGITRTRKRVRDIKMKLRSGRPTREEATRLKRQLRQCEARIEDYGEIIYFIRCFGDGIAFIYLDGFALKHTYYKTTDYTVREQAGFITANSGFGNECRVARRFLSAGVPVLLCDITNVVRYGDICFLIGPDPQLLEVKSSRNQNARTIRQQHNLAELRDFYVNDGADEFRGKKGIVRQPLHAKAITHDGFMNDLIRRASKNEMASGSPEHGLLYVAWKVGSVDFGKVENVIESFCERPCAAFSLNEAKNSATWLPLHPFTLSLSADHVAPFILGHIFLLVIIDLGAFKWNFAKLGAAAVVLKDNDYAIQVTCDSKEPSAGVFRVSQQMFQRIALEFWSLEWFANEQTTMGARVVPRGVDAGEGHQIPQAWLELDDGIPVHAPSQPSDEVLEGAET